jgi:hypothetical protein
MEQHRNADSGTIEDRNKTGVNVIRPVRSLGRARFDPSVLNVVSLRLWIGA